MNKRINNFLENNIVSLASNLKLLTYQNSIEFIKILNVEGIRIYGFDGFTIFKNGKYQINQDYSRDYSRFSKEESFNLTMEFFSKTEYKDKYYSISYDGKE